MTLDAPTSEVCVDTTIRGGGYASADFSNSDVLEVKNATDVELPTARRCSSSTRRTAIPAGAVINSARLYLVLKGADDSTLRPIGVYRVTKSFLPSQTNWLDYRDGDAWSQQGGDLGSRYTVTNVGGTAGTTYSFDLTNLVQQTVNGDFGSRYTRVVLVDTGVAADGAFELPLVAESPTARCGRSW